MVSSKQADIFSGYMLELIKLLKVLYWSSKTGRHKRSNSCSCFGGGGDIKYFTRAMENVRDFVFFL